MEERKRPSAPSMSLCSATRLNHDPQSHRTPTSKRARISSSILVAAVAAPDFKNLTTSTDTPRTLTTKRSVSFAPRLETVHSVPSIKDLLSADEMQKLWLRSECILRTIDEAVSEAAEQEETHRAAQEQYLQILTETYYRCCEQDADNDDGDGSTDCSKAFSLSSTSVSPLLASYRGLEFAVVPELLKLRSCQRATSIQNLCALARQLQSQTSAASASASSLASVASRSSRTARRFARAMGVADSLVVAAQEQGEQPIASSASTTKNESNALTAADGGCLTAATFLLEAPTEKAAARA